MNKSESENKETKRRSGRNRGFTLIELMIGVSLFALALFGTLMVLSQSLAYSKFSNNRTIAMNEARRVIEEIRRVADENNLATVINTDWTNWASNIDILDNENTTVTDLGGNPLQIGTNPLPIRVAVNWTEKGRAAVYAVDTLITSR